MEYLISIIMPVYNGEAFIGEAIRSVLDQSYPNWELIIIDDGSNDDTSNIVNAFSDSRIRYTYQENRGQSAALNKGFDLAIGDYVTTLDSDDWYPQNSLYDRVCYLDQHPQFSAVYGDGYYCDESGKLLKRFSDYRKSNLEGNLYEALVESSFFGTNSPVMFSRQSIEQRRLRYDEAIFWSKDWDFFIRLAQNIEFGYVDSIVAYYRLHGANMTLALPEGRRLESLIRTKKKVLESAQFANVSVSTKRIFFYILLIDNIMGKLDLQEDIISGPQFCALPDQEKSRLLRLMAEEYILSGENVKEAKRWLRAAWKMTPTEPKLLFITLITHLNKNLAKYAIGNWRARQKREVITSPLEMIKQ